jgi:hypothetical protein
VHVYVMKRMKVVVCMHARMMSQQFVLQAHQHEVDLTAVVRTWMSWRPLRLCKRTQTGRIDVSLLVLVACIEVSTVAASPC